MFWRYSTLSPCSTLTKTLREAVLQEAVSEAMTSAQMPSPETSAQARIPDVDHRIASLSPAQCTEALIEFERSDERSFMKAFFAQPPLRIPDQSCH